MQEVKQRGRVGTTRQGHQNPLAHQIREGRSEVFGKIRQKHASSYPIQAGCLVEKTGLNWWRWVDLNHRHRAYETPALPLSYTARPSTIAAVFDGVQPVYLTSSPRSLRVRRIE